MTDQKPEQKIYTQGVKEATNLESESGRRSNVLHKAYEAAVAELGYSDKELMDTAKAKKVAKLMFSSKYLGNTEFNPLLNDKKYGGFAQKSEIDQQRDYQMMLGMNLDNFVSGQGIIERYGSLRRGAFNQALERQHETDSAQRMMAWAWQKVYNPDKPLSDNIEAYANLLRQDPILSGSGAKLDAGRFQSIDDVAQAAATSMMGQQSREALQYRHGVDFN